MVSVGMQSCIFPHASYLEGSKGLLSSQLSDACRPPPYSKGSMGLPNTMHSDAYMPAPYLEGSTGLPNAISGDADGWSSAYDIYQVDDTVAANELYMSSGLQAVDNVSSSLHPTCTGRGSFTLGSHYSIP